MSPVFFFNNNPVFFLSFFITLFYRLAVWEDPCVFGKPRLFSSWSGGMDMGAGGGGGHTGGGFCLYRQTHLLRHRAIECP